MDNRGRGRGRGDRGGFRGRGGGGPRGGGPPRGGSQSSFGRGRGGRGGGSAPVQVFAPDKPAQPDARLNERELTALVSRFKNLSASVPDRVIRPGFGKRGTAVTLRANFFALKYPKNCVLYDYPVEITPPTEDKEKRLWRRLFDLFESSREVAPYLQGIAHDRVQRLIAKQALPDGFSVSVPFYDEGRTPHPRSKVYKFKLL